MGFGAERVRPPPTLVWTMRVTLIRRYRFRASHHYGRSDWSTSRNQGVFGAQTDPHFHDWALDVTICGIPDPETGFLMDLEALDDLVEKRALSLLAAGDMNRSVPEVRDGAIQPSTEALALWVWGRLDGNFPPGVALLRVRLAESDDLSSEVWGPQPPGEGAV